MKVTPCTLVDHIHQTPVKVGLIATGGGGEVLGLLTHRGGGSNTLINFQCPYDPADSFELIGGKPDKLVSEATARALAMSAYQHARKRSDGPVIGVAATSSLQKVPSEREGRNHEIFAALQTGTKTVSLTLHIESGRDLVRHNAFGTWYNPNAEAIRVTEEKINAQMLLNLIAEGSSLEDRIHIGYGVEQKIVRKESTIDLSLSEVLAKGKVPFEIRVRFDGSMLINKFDPADEQQYLLVPGSFNPAHDAHFEIAMQSCIAAKAFYESKKIPKQLAPSAGFEMSMTNVDKPMLDLLTIEERLKTFNRRAGLHTVWITNTPTFVDKVKRFGRNTMFAIGHDTALRIVDPKYGNLDAAYNIFAETEAHFFIFGRNVDGKYVGGGNIGFPFTPKMVTHLTLPDKFHDVSSTAVRASVE